MGQRPWRRPWAGGGACYAPLLSYRCGDLKPYPLARTLLLWIDLTDMRDMEPDALALEYQRDYGSARWNCNVAYLMNNSIPESVCRVFGPGFSEEFLDFRFRDARPLLNNTADPFLIGQQAV
jgi:hypothetical protein